MKWLEQLKELLVNNPETSDAEIFRAFPELKYDQKLLTAALMYVHYGHVALEFRKDSKWKRFLKFLTNAFRRISYRAA